jgi:hypothetical protein
MKRKYKLYQDSCQLFRRLTHNYMVIALIIFINFPSLNAQWIQQGPGPSKNGQVENITDREITGAINCVAPHPTDADILYIGGVNGGIWRTGDATANSPAWVFISDDLTSQSIGALEFDPTDAAHLTLVAGSGRTSSFSSVGSGTRSIFRTTTGSGPWANIDVNGTFASRDITGIAARGATIVVASRNGGIFRTTNTGGLWIQISGATGTGIPAGNSLDLVSDPNNNAILYTNAGTSGIYKSIDTGVTWTKVSDAAIDADLVGAGNLELAVGNSNNVYLAIVRGGRLADLYRSGNGGTNWTALDVPTTAETVSNIGIHPGGQGNIHLSLCADPSNANVVYVGGDRQPWAAEPDPNGPFFPNSIGANDFSGRLFRVDASLAVGSQATPITHIGTASNSAPHADSRDMDFNVNGDLIESDDGGVYKQTSPSDATGDWLSVNGNLNVTETHSVDWDANSNIIISGAQDNGIPQQEFPTNSKWKSVSTGDGGDVSIDDVSSAKTSARYSSAQNLLSFRRMVYSTGNVFQSQVFPTLIDAATGLRITGFSFVTPIKLNSQDGTRLLVATTGGLFESSDQGNTVNNIGTFSVNGTGRDAIAYGAADNADILYVGVGATVRIRTAAPPAALNTSATYTGGNVEGIVMDPNDSQSAYVIDPTHVFETTNAGGAWQDITGNLLTLSPGSFRSIAYIPTNANDILAVGTDLGVFIAPGPAFNTWAKLGTNLPQVAVYDLEYDTKDGILLAATMGRGTWTWSFSERDPVDVALVVDYSGSMLSKACPACSPKLEVLEDAVEIFMQLWKGLAIADDRIGIVYFRTNVNNFQIGGNTMLSVIDETDNMVADLRSQTTTSSQTTAMGGGLQSAINELTDATRPRNIVLFTDGMQNVDPGVDFPTLAIQNGEFGPNSNINPTDPPTVLNAALGIKVNTIGVGATNAFETQLTQIASGTGGITKITTAPDEDLRQFFVEELVDALRNFSPQLVAYRKGVINEIKTESFSINNSAKEIVFKVSYHRYDKIAINIIKGQTDVTQFAIIKNGPFYQIFSFPFEQLILLKDTKYDGPWSVQMRTANNISYEIAAIANEASLKYKLSIDNELYKEGEPIHLSAQILVNNELITDDVTVSATVKYPGKGLGTILSKIKMPVNKGIVLEPGLPAGAQKLTLLSQNIEFVNSIKPMESQVTLNPDAGRTFRADFTNTSIPGAYTIIYTIKGNHPYIGPFERIEQRTVNVRFSKFDFDASDVLTNRKGPDINGIYTWTWTFSPTDKSGNYLGPDFGNVMVINSPDGTIQNTRDIGNGYYEFDILTSIPDQPRLTLGLYDEIWYDDLVPHPIRSKFSASIHAGVAIPEGNLSNSFDVGSFGKLDFEYRWSNHFSIQLTGGIYNFRKGLNIGFSVLHAKGYLPVTPRLKLFSEAGTGAFVIKNAATYLGYDIGIGLEYKVASRFRISLGGNYIGLLNHPEDYKWLAIGAGFHFQF